MIKYVWCCLQCLFGMTVTVCEWHPVMMSMVVAVIGFTLAMVLADRSK